MSHYLSPADYGWTYETVKTGGEGVGGAGGGEGEEGGEFHKG